jgi:regulatory protein
MKLKMSSKTRLEYASGSLKPEVSAKSKVIKLLARREHSQFELRMKLFQNGYQSAEIEEAIEWAISNQFQSDNRFKLSLFRRRAQTFGDRAISAELNQHGFARDDLAMIGREATLIDVNYSEAERAYHWIKRRQYVKLTSIVENDAQELHNPNQMLNIKTKIFRALSSRGFAFCSIEKAWCRTLAELKSNA